MIKNKTVFVFGAGLSSDYGFPTGQRLRDDIVEYINWNRSNSDLPARIKLLVKMGFDEDTIIRARETIRGGCFDTIDQFMETRPEFRPLTKALIASIIIQHEHPDISLEMDSTKLFL